LGYPRPPAIAPGRPAVAAGAIPSRPATAGHRRACGRGWGDASASDGQPRPSRGDTLGPMEPLSRWPSGVGRTLASSLTPDRWKPGTPVLPPPSRAVCPAAHRPSLGGSGASATSITGQLHWGRSPRRLGPSMTARQATGSSVNCQKTRMDTSAGSRSSVFSSASTLSRVSDAPAISNEVQYSLT